MDATRMKNLYETYRTALLDDVTPFWLRYSHDGEYGGYISHVDRDGTVLSTDKSVWIQGRGTWIFSRLYNTVEKRSEWLEASRSGYDFLAKYCFDTDGRMFFQVTRDGKPLRKRRYLFSETFGIIGCAEYARAAGDRKALQKAKDTYAMLIDLYTSPGSLPPKVYPETRAAKSHAMPMILIATTQVMREIDSDPLYNKVIDSCIDEVLNHFVKRNVKALLETVGPNGEMLDIPQGRCINPGHAIETSWFLMHEGIYRNDRKLIDRALEILEWSLERGWDEQYGGLLYYVDVDGKPPEQLEWDMKLWWPHTEALYALLLACHLNEDTKYEKWFDRMYEWTFSHFPDPQYGEWYGYLHRDGTISQPVKGNMWKGLFHVPRFFLYSIKLLEKMLQETGRVN